MTESKELLRLLGRTKAAQYLGISIARVQQLRNEGRLHPLDTPLGYLYDPADLDRYKAEKDRAAGKRTTKRRKHIYLQGKRVLKPLPKEPVEESPKKGVIKRACKVKAKVPEPPAPAQLPEKTQALTPAEDLW